MQDYVMMFVEYQAQVYSFPRCSYILSYPLVLYTLNAHQMQPFVKS